MSREFHPGDMVTVDPAYVTERPDTPPAGYVERVTGDNVTISPLNGGYYAVIPNASLTLIKRPYKPVPHVWVVNCVEEVDGIYVFEDEEQARQFSARYALVSVTEEVVMDKEAGARFLAEVMDEDDA